MISASLELARTEDAAMEAVYSARSALKPDTAAMVKKFEIRAHRLSAQAEALTGAGSVLGGLAGSQGVLDRIVSPMAFAGRELLSRLSMQSERKVSLQRIQRFKKAPRTLLGLASNNQVNTETLEAWTAAEAALHDATEAIDLALRHSRNIATGSKEHDDVSALRVGLGLSRTGSEWVLTTLDNANTAAHAAFGPLPGAHQK